MAIPGFSTCRLATTIELLCSESWLGVGSADLCRLVEMSGGTAGVGGNGQGNSEGPSRVRWM